MENAYDRIYEESAYNLASKRAASIHNSASRNGGDDDTRADDSDDGGDVYNRSLLKSSSSSSTKSSPIHQFFIHAKHDSPLSSLLGMIMWW